MPPFGLTPIGTIQTDESETFSDIARVAWTYGKHRIPKSTGAPLLLSIQIWCIQARRFDEDTTNKVISHTETTSVHSSRDSAQ